jgi:PAS domain S-box-containing protein
MHGRNITPTGVERFLGEEEIIVSKTDPSGRITYVNQTFLTISSFVESEVIGQPHSMVRHPRMPRCVFQLLWDTIRRGEEIFAYVCNLAKNGDHYWVFAHVTPTFNAQGDIIGYHSNRRAPERKTLDTVMGLYDTLLSEEQRGGDRKRGLESSIKLLDEVVHKKASAYDEFICSL